MIVFNNIAHDPKMDDKKKLIMNENIRYETTITNIIYV